MDMRAPQLLIDFFCYMATNCTAVTLLWSGPYCLHYLYLVSNLPCSKGNNEIFSTKIAHLQSSVFAYGNDPQ